ncbi:MAG: hypothetical protein ACT4TC_00120 [Myxococcaceae bacterium]
MMPSQNFTPGSVIHCFAWSYRPSAEDRLENVKAQVDIELSKAEILELLNSGHYQVSGGLRGGRHYRKERGNGCFHLRVLGEQAYLHWDQWDPRRYPLQHFFETPELWASALGLVALALVPSARSALK